MLLSKLLKNKKSKKSKNTVKKPLNTQKNSKVYWFLLKVFLNNKKIPVIPSLFDENGFITDFKKKNKLFNFYASKEFFLSVSNRSLSADVNYITDKCLSVITFPAKDIGKIIQNFDRNKTMDMIT